MTKHTTLVADSEAGDAEADKNQQRGPSDGCSKALSEKGTARDTAVATPARRRWPRWMRGVGFGVLPAIALLLGLAAGFLRYQIATAEEVSRSGREAVQAATESTIAILSYTPDTAEKSLTTAQGRLTEPFRDAYASLTKDVVIPGAKQKHISATATVPAAAAVSVSQNHAVVMVFVDQVITMGNQAPTSTASVAQVTLDKHGDRWLISAFDPK